jgi:hypothetical protein
VRSFALRWPASAKGTTSPLCRRFAAGAAQGFVLGAAASLLREATHNTRRRTIVRYVIPDSPPYEVPTLLLNLTLPPAMSWDCPPSFVVAPSSPLRCASTPTPRVPYQPLNSSDPRLRQLGR